MKESNLLKISNSLLAFEKDNCKREEEMDKEVLELHISKKLKTITDIPINGKIEIIKRAFDEKFFSDLSSDCVKCNNCSSKILDSLSVMVSHLEMLATKNLLLTYKIIQVLNH